MQLKILLILLAIFFLTLACSSADILNMIASATPTPTAAPTHTSTPQPTPTPRETPKLDVLPTNTSPPGETEAPYSITIEEDGWQKYQNFEYRFSLNLPPEWEILDLTVDDLKALLNEMVNNNPAMESYFTSEYLNNLVSAGIKLIAIDASVASLSSGSTSNLNVLVADLLFEITLVDYIEVNVAQIKSVLGEELEVNEEIVMIGELEAGKITYNAEITDIFGNPQQVEYRQYLILDGRTQYVLTFTAGMDKVQADAPIFDQITDSFTLTD
ncbi:MAG: hypothetical protein PVI99_00745 [Anaerolineales bacterium]|jgi:hypothetical protein